MIIPIFPIVEYFVMIKNNEGKRIGDKVAKTKVNDLDPQAKDSAYFWISLAIVIALIIIQAIIAQNLIKQHPELLKK